MWFAVLYEVKVTKRFHVSSSRKLGGEQKRGMKGCGEDRRKRWSQIRNVLDWSLFKPCLCEGLSDLSWKEVSLASLLFRPFKVYLEIEKWKLVKANLLGMTACRCCSSILTSSLIFSKPAQFFSTSLIFVNQLLINCLKKGFFFLGWGWKIWAWLFEGGSEKKSDARWKRRRTKDGTFPAIYYPHISS